jgi:hypothetical protein
MDDLEKPRKLHSDAKLMKHSNDPVNLAICLTLDIAQ